uniref:Gypsy retrotransposon integrase-like protein 1 n=5 Tax=Gasterosteus aculeatus aculeatus TaxID=481459 RepID=A0AAQ4QM75_GASAC
MFTSAPVLRHPDPALPFVVEVDASETGAGGVLSQRQGKPAKLHPCAFFSHKLTSAERNYDVGNRELLAVKLAFEEWRHWLEGAKHPFLVLTDHRNLEYIQSAKRLNPRQARWSLFFTRFDFILSYRPGSKNGKADALSRLQESASSQDTPGPILPPKHIIAPIRWDIMGQIQQALPGDPIPQGCPGNKTYVPAAVRAQLLQWMHSCPSSGHPGIQRTLALAREQFWWPSLTQDVTDYVQACTTCAQTRSPRDLPSGLLEPLPIPNRPWSHMAVDFITDLPCSQGFTTILVAVDRFSKACRLIPLKKLPSALETAESLFHHVFRTFGLPEEIVSDRGVQFTSKVWAAFFKMLNVQVNLSSGYHPQSNGQTERLNQEIGRFLRAYCFQQPGEWSRFLPWAEYAQNSHKSTSTRISPFQCMLGFQPALFPWSGEPSEILAVDNWLRRSRTVWDATRTEIQRAVQRQKKYADQRRRPAPRFQPGQDVWLSTRNIRLRLPSKKLSPRFIGPFKIIKQINTVSYRLQLPSHYRINPTFHVSLLKPAVRTEGGQSGPEVQPAPPPPLLDDGVTYTVRALLNSRRRQSGLQYLVDWEGYGPEERAWRPAADIHPDLITDFHQAHPECPGPRPRGRPPRRGRTSASGAACRRGGSVTGRRSPSPEY